MTATIISSSTQNIVSQTMTADKPTTNNNINKNNNNVNNTAVVLSPTIKNDRRRNRVQFLEENQLEKTKIIESIDDLTRQERQNLWYTRTEMNRLRKVCDTLASEHLAFYTDEELLERFGIQSASYRRQRHIRVRWVVRCVIIHQQQQRLRRQLDLFEVDNDDDDEVESDDSDSSSDSDRTLTDDDKEDNPKFGNVVAVDMDLYTNISKASTESAILRAMRIEKKLYRQ
jgi:hypothetical protein